VISLSIVVLIDSNGLQYIIATEEQTIWMVLTME